MADDTNSSAGRGAGKPGGDKMLGTVAKTIAIVKRGTGKKK